MIEKPVRLVLVLAAVAGFSAILMGTFGAHLLPTYLESRDLDEETFTRRVDQFDVAVRYHLVHVPILLAAACLPLGGRVLRWLGLLFFAGMVVFCGSLYLLVILNMPWLGAITPFGALLWLVAWVILGIAALKGNPDSAS